jgi:hypothetical protein
MSLPRISLLTKKLKH